MRDTGKKVTVRWRNNIKWFNIQKDAMKVWNGVLYFTSAMGKEVAISDNWMWEEE